MTRSKSISRGFDLACIAGANGAGKSSILDAITWVLFGQGRKRDESLINTQSEAAEVTLVFAYEGNLFRVMRANPRGKTGVLEFHIAQSSDPLSENNHEALVIDSWKPLTEHTTRATQSCIEETLRLDYDTFINAAFFLQGKADQFTQQRPGDRKRILASILGLETWETFRQRTAARRRAIDTEITVLDGRLSEINTELSEERARKDRLAELEAELERLVDSRITQEKSFEHIKKIAATLEEQHKLVDTMARQLETAQKRMSELESRVESRQKEKETHAEIIIRKEEIQEAYQRLLAARADLNHWEEIAAEFREHEKRRQSPLTTIEAERARLAQERESLEEQQSAVSSQQSTENILQSKITNLESSIANLQTEFINRKSLESELATAQESLANAKAENPRLKAEMDELKVRIVQLTETDGAACPLCGQPLSQDERKNLITELETIGKSMGDKWRANRALLTESGDRVSNLQSQISNLQSLDEDLLLQRSNLNKLTTQIEQIEVQNLAWQKEGFPRLEKLTDNLQNEIFRS